MEFLKDISVNLISDAIWRIGELLFIYLILKKSTPGIQQLSEDALFKKNLNFALDFY